MVFSFAVLLVAVHALVFIKINPVACAYDGSSWDRGQAPDQKLPLDVMVDVVNKFAISLLMVHNENNHDDNIALSPYGATSVLVALAEGLVGEGASEIGHTLNLPADVSVMRVGFRDILRHLKSYFIPKEGFLAGLTLSHDNITLSKEYEDILNFYGYDIDNFNNPLYPSNSTDSPPIESTTVNVEGREVTEPVRPTPPTKPTPKPDIPATKTPNPINTTKPATILPTSISPSTTVGVTTVPPVITPTAPPSEVPPAPPSEVPQTPPTEAPPTEASPAPPTEAPSTPPIETPPTDAPPASPAEEPPAPPAEAPPEPPAAEAPPAEDPPARRRRKRSLVDYKIAKYLDNYNMNNNYRNSYVDPNKYNNRRSYEEPTNTNRRNYEEARYINDEIIPEEPYTFLINGVYRETNIDFMTYDTVLPFTYIPGLDSMALRFPLDSTEYYLLLVLPINEIGINSLIDNFRKFASLASIVSNLKYSHVKAIIPSFELKGNSVLTHSLQKLCIKRIFEPRRADFSRMTAQPDIYVTNIEQSVTVNIKNYMDPDKMYEGDMGSYRPVIFRADHPFLYFVMDAETNVNLMAGKIINPLNSRVA